MATVRIPTQLRPLSAGAAEVAVDGKTVGEVLAALDRAHPGFTGRLFDDAGQLRRFVNVFVADEDVRFLKGLDTEITDGSTVSIIPAVAGGSGCETLLRRGLLLALDT
ncbi:MAG: ubiquitin-like small modifier protein 1 [Acidimicrobiales bacterium]